MRFLGAGERSVLVELESSAQVHRLHRAVLRAGFALDAVPAWSTLLVTSVLPRAELEAALAGLTLEDDEQPAREVEIPVRYDGQDLDDVAAAVGLTPEAVVGLHSQVTYTVAFLGFARGFPYLAGLPAALHLPRRPTPRTRVAAGSVAIAGDACGIYPQASPGGWHVIASSTVTLFDPSWPVPSCLLPGDLVRFTEACVSEAR